jgi:hypothetical protein
MTEKKLKRCNELAKEIKLIKIYLETAKHTQSENVVATPMIFDFTGYDKQLLAPESLFRIIGKLILDEYEQKLIELEKEFFNL